MCKTSATAFPPGVGTELSVNLFLARRRSQILVVARGPIATVEIGVEVKILAKAMIKQIDRVKNDLRHQVTEFKLGGGSPICIAVVGINQAESMIGYEGDRPWPTTGKAGFLPPFQEAPRTGGGSVGVAAPRV